MPKLDKFLKGVKVVQGKEGRAPQRKRLITLKILWQICTQLPLVGKDHVKTMAWVAALVCFFGFMRAGKLMIDKKGGLA